MKYFNIFVETNEMNENHKAVNIYAESTPNASAMKFVSDFVLLDKEYNLEFDSMEEAMNISPLATELFKFPFVKSVHIRPFFITVIKNDMASWDDISLHLREVIRDFIRMGIPAINADEDLPKTSQKEDLIIVPETNDETSQKIIQILDEYVRPAVESDGGTIQFRSFKDGVVKVGLGGSCNGCPSTTVTLKGGVENLLKQMLPGEVQEVVADEH
jgi:Fe-S cluster biogenesis protein NfuA